MRTGREQVSGIGGFFSLASRPDEPGRWYEEQLGVSCPPATYDDPAWQQEAGQAVGAAFGAKAREFGRGARMAIMNFRVRDPDAMVAQLRRTRVLAELGSEQYPHGRFASLADPEGNLIQLWQPTVPGDR